MAVGERVGGGGCAVSVAVGGASVAVLVIVGGGSVGWVLSTDVDSTGAIEQLTKRASPSNRKGA